MRVRTVLIVMTAVAVAATPAVAAPKKKKPAPPPKVCNLLTDVKGDGTWNTGAGIVKSDALDIVSADIATGAKEFVATLRLAKSVDASGDNWANLSYEWRLGASGNGVRYEFSMRRGLGPTAQKKNLTTASVGGQAVAHKFAVVGDTLVWRFERKASPALAKPRIVWGDFGANSNVLSSTADTGASEKKYSDRAPSCVAAL